MMREWDDETDDQREEGSAMLGKLLKGENPWECRRKNTWLRIWLGFSIVINILQALLLLETFWLLYHRQ